MKQFELTLVVRKPDGKFESMDKIEADDLVQLVCQLNLVIITIQRKMHEEYLLGMRMENDDIPF